MQSVKCESQYEEIPILHFTFCNLHLVLAFYQLKLADEGGVAGTLAQLVDAGVAA